MGLDQYIYKKDKNGNTKKLVYYRKFNALQGYIYNIQDEFGADIDNGKNLELTPEIVACLKEKVKEGLIILFGKSVIDNYNNHKLNFDKYLTEDGLKLKKDGVTVNRINSIPSKFVDWGIRNFPPCVGFFFGSQRIDMYYILTMWILYGNMLDVEEMLKNGLNEGEKIYYSCWW